MSESSKNKKPWLTGRKHTAETKLKMSINKGMKTFQVFNKKTHELVGEWISMAQCGRDLAIKNYRNIGYVLQGKRRSCDGYIFKYKE